MGMRIFSGLGLLIALLILAGARKDPGPQTAVQLGRKLFFDPMLSSDRSVSCASCHKPALAFADSVAFSRGVGGQFTARNTPSVMNMAMRDLYFWDGRAVSLEHQVVFPIENPVEMNLPFREAVQRIQASAVYQRAFRKIFGRQPDSILIVQSIAAFERSLETGDTPSDRWLEDKPGAMTASQIRGRELFTSDRTHCFDCHFTPDLTSDEFRNIGLFNGKNLNDSGRYRITHKVEDIGKFKIPGLRNVALTAPYMHNGMFRTLREVIDYYDQPGLIIPDALGRDSLLGKKIGLTEQEKVDLEAYLRALTDDRFTRKKRK